MRERREREGEEKREGRGGDGGEHKAIFCDGGGPSLQERS